MHVIPICLCAMLAWLVVIRSAEKTTLHRGAFLTIFVRISTDKQNTWIFGNFSDQLDEILKDSCDFWRFLEIFGLKVWNFST